MTKGEGGGQKDLTSFIDGPLLIGGFFLYSKCMSNFGAIHLDIKNIKLLISEEFYSDFSSLLAWVQNFEFL